MSHLAMIGPEIVVPDYSNYDPRTPFTFKYEEMNPFVGEFYRLVTHNAGIMGANVSFPIDVPNLGRRGKWMIAVQRLASADAAVAVAVGRSRAIPVEASLAVAMEVPLVVAALDDSVSRFEQRDVPVYDIRYGTGEFTEAMGEMLGRVSEGPPGERAH
jgi:hypothetical protein